MNLFNRLGWKLKRTILGALPRGYYFKISGFCPCCREKTIFEAFDPWLRDHFVCRKCRSIPRERALIRVIEAHHPNWSELRIHESSSSNNAASKLLSTAKGYLGTQYYPNERFGETFNGFRNENLEDQTFDDKEFDLVITQDVMEHVFAPEKAFSEIGRTLKRNGSHIFSVPLINKHRPTEVWATLGKDGKPEFLKTPEFHGNPIDPDGSPVTMHWGFDIVDFVDSKAGMKSTIEFIDDLEYGIRAEYIEIVVSRKI